MAEEFSIIVPVLNRKELICRCLDSIKAQTYRPIHVIVVDNNSSDGTFSAIAEWGHQNTEPGFRMSVLSEKTPGAAAARNRGFQAVNGDKLCFFDSDDVMRPELVAEAMRAFDENPDAQIVLWKAILHKLNGGYRRLKFVRDDFMAQHIFHSILTTTHYAVRRQFFSNHGVWDENMSVWNDWELGVRMLLVEPQVALVPKTLVEVYAQEESITGSSLTSKAGQWEAAISTAEGSVMKSRRDDKERLKRLLDYVRIILAARYAREGSIKQAHNLFVETMDGFSGSTFQKFILRLCYSYRLSGGRGSAYLANLIL